MLSTYFRFLSEWWAFDGCSGRRNNIWWCARRWFCPCVHSGSGTESKTNLWPGCGLSEILHNLWTSRGIWTLLCVSRCSWSSPRSYSAHASLYYCWSSIHIFFLFRNMTRPVTYWYTKDQPIFENTDELVDSRIDVTRIPAGSDTPPCLKISHNTFETMEKANWEFLRLCLPVICQSSFIE